MVLSRQLVALLYEELAIQTEQDSQITPYLIKKNALVLALPFDSFSLKLKIKGLVPPRSKVRSGMRINIRPLGNCGENGCAKASRVFPESRIIVTGSARKYLVMKTTLY